MQQNLQFMPKSFYPLPLKNTQELFQHQAIRNAAFDITVVLRYTRRTRRSQPRGAGCRDTQGTTHAWASTAPQAAQPDQEAPSRAETC